MAAEYYSRISTHSNWNFVERPSSKTQGGPLYRDEGHSISELYKPLIIGGPVLGLADHLFQRHFLTRGSTLDVSMPWGSARISMMRQLDLRTIAIRSQPSQPTNELWNVRHDHQRQGDEAAVFVAHSQALRVRRRKAVSLPAVCKPLGAPSHGEHTVASLWREDHRSSCAAQCIAASQQKTHTCHRRKGDASRD